MFAQPRLRIIEELLLARLQPRQIEQQQQLRLGPGQGSKVRSDDLGREHVDQRDKGGVEAAQATSQEHLSEQHIDVHVEVAVHDVGLGQLEKGQKHGNVGHVLKKSGPPGVEHVAPSLVGEKDVLDSVLCVKESCQHANLLMASKCQRTKEPTNFLALLASR